MVYFNLLSTLVPWGEYSDSVEALGDEIGAMIDLYTSIVIWVTVALAIGAAVLGLFVRKNNPEAFAPYAKKLGVAAVGYALAVGVSMLFLSFYEMYVKDYFVKEVFIPVAVLMGAVVLAIFGYAVCKAIGVKNLKAYIIGAILAVLGVFVYSLIALEGYFNDNIANDGYYEGMIGEGIVSFVGDWQLYVSAIILVCVVLFIAVTSSEKKAEYDSRSISYAAICIAMSFALSYLKLFPMPQGGSVTLASLLPLMLYSYMFGVKKGVFAGAIYGILQAIQDPWILHPAQFLLDYPIAFAAIGTAGLFAKNKSFSNKPQAAFTCGALVAGALRFCSHFLSGAFAFSAYAIDAGYSNAYIYSLAYNSFVFVDLAVVIAVGALALSSKAFAKTVKQKVANS